MIIETILGMVFLTAPAAPAPEQYIATAYALPGVSLAYRGWDGWVQPHLCFDRCSTVPGQRTQLLRGELSAADMADLQLTVWRKDGDRWVQVMHCARWFDGRPICARWGQ
ncbi:hypothetical protein [Acidovorax sp. Root219]|uniref:hypothetical protein n=1 Tax=Acidovorax sp. Root219 TaxID=1736493 RepID=UPI0007105691|nr:hypothetical protein [Acidovorax sp. Root219]KRC36223.1 hypothetical protein ASE28_01430 [Acidovorax sp. Root219]